MKQTIKEQLLQIAEPNYQKFEKKLLPGVSNILGVRLPKLQKIAQKIAKQDVKFYLQNASDDSYEEIMLQGMVIGCANVPMEEGLTYVSAFLPKINNRALCDNFCSSLKTVQEADPTRMWMYLRACLKDGREYYVRFGIVMMILYYIDDSHIDRILMLLNSVRQEDNEVRTAIVWAVSACFFAYPEKTMGFLKLNTLDDLTFNKAIRKIVESDEVDSDLKKEVLALKR